MRYYNNTTKKYYNDGESLTWEKDGVLFSGIPSAEQLAEQGYEPYTPPVATEPTQEVQARLRMAEIQMELTHTDYLALKAYEGEDMSEHEGWKGHRAALRAEYRELENITTE
jgi:hypothetical protein